MFKKIISSVLSLVLLFQCFVNVSAYSDNVPPGNTEINMLASQIDHEMEEKREENVKYFKLKDEQTLKVEYPTAVHTKNKDGKWEDLYNKERKNTIRFSENSGSDELVRIEREQYALAWNLENTLDSPISEIDENHKLYKNVYQDVDLDYSLSENKLKENVVLNSESSQKEFTVNYYLKDLTPYQTDSKTIELLNKNQKCVYTISAPKMLDATGKSCENLSLEILNCENDKLKVKIVCDKSWLEEKERVYPILVDPDYTYESFDYQVSAHPTPSERIFRTKWRKKDTGESVFLNLVGSDFSGLGVVKVQVFGKNSRGEENCTYETQCYFLEADKQYELYNKINEEGY